MLGFSPLSTYPFSAVPSYYAVSGVTATGVIRSVTTSVNSVVNVTGVYGTGVIRSVASGAGTSVTVTRVSGTGVLDHVCFRTWDEVDTIDC